MILVSWGFFSPLCGLTSGQRSAAPRRALQCSVSALKKKKKRGGGNIHPVIHQPPETGSEGESGKNKAGKSRIR